MTRRQILEHLTEAHRVRGPEIRRRFHAREDHRDASALCLFDDLRQVPQHFFGRKAAEAIVRAEGEDQYADIAFKRPVQPPESSGGGVP
jgi:hypothetical protein